ncbi:RES domain-containing protein [Ornithinimicrobium murale]|uniref:RES domain-containing protein n=1 Tax=Ornithinimicrobium murale TaxID=1050153 RepID=UPI001EE06D58
MQRTGGQVESWGRWDVDGHRTAYAADSEYGAYIEVLKYLSPSPRLNVATRDVFPDDDSTEQPGTLLDVIRSQWDDQFTGFTVGKLPQVWRDERRLYELQLPWDGWLVDIEHSDTLTALNARIAQVLPPDSGDSRDVVDALTRGHLTGESRRITTTVAAYIHAVVLQDGSLPHGIAFGSKHGQDLGCLAAWLRKMDDGHPTNLEPTKLTGTFTIDLDNETFKRAADQVGLQAF